MGLSLFLCAVLIARSIAIKIIAIFNGLSVPPISIEAFFNIFRKSEVGSCR